VSDNNATCTADGTKTAKCDRCDVTDTKADTGSAKGHSFGDWEIVTSPNCTDKGSEKRVCSVCDYTETRDVNENGHSWDSDFTIDKAPTCTEEGSKSIHCKNCDVVKDSTVVDANGHTETIDNAVAPTCTETGLTQGVHCSACDEVILAQEVVSALGHSFTNYVSDGNATCTADGTKTAKCDRCDVTDTVKDTGSAKGHKSVTDKAVSPTCTKSGLTKGSHCSVCGKVLVKQKAVAKLGHKYSWVTTKKATYFTAGTSSYKCSVCKNVSKTKAIAKLQLKAPTVKLSATTSEINVKLSKVADATGYQIMYSTSSDFSNAKTLKTKSVSEALKGLKANKKYYVKSRAYITKNGKTAYGAWSSSVSITTKKPVSTTNSTTYVVKKDDNLWNIAVKYYGDGTKYTKIYNANKDKIKDPDLIYAGQVLIIPQ
jgi:hypothetical protein